VSQYEKNGMNFDIVQKNDLVFDMKYVKKYQGENKLVQPGLF